MSEKYCFNCRYYKAYYTKSSVKFEKLNYGLCWKSKNTVEPRNGCELYSHKYLGRLDANLTTLKAVTDNIHLLAELKQILEEDDEDMLEEMILRKKVKKAKDMERLAKASADSAEEDAPL